MHFVDAPEGRTAISSVGDIIAHLGPRRHAVVLERAEPNGWATAALLAALHRQREYTRRFSGLVARFHTDLPESGAATVEENLIAFARAMLELNTGTLPLVAGLLTEPPLLQRFHEVIHSEPFGPHLYPQRLAEYLTGEQRIGRLPDVDVDASTT